jgi:restriction endonuclease S subunit
MKLITDITTDIPVSEMKDGDIAIVTKWKNDYYTGQVVQRYKDYLIRVGKPSKQGWGGIFKKDHDFLTDKSCMVRILPSGTVLEIE